MNAVVGGSNADCFQLTKYIAGSLLTINSQQSGAERNNLPQLNRSSLWIVASNLLTPGEFKLNADPEMLKRCQKEIFMGNRRAQRAQCATWVPDRGLEHCYDGSENMHEQPCSRVASIVKKISAMWEIPPGDSITLSLMEKPMNKSISVFLLLTFFAQANHALAQIDAKPEETPDALVAALNDKIVQISRAHEQAVTVLESAYKFKTEAALNDTCAKLEAIQKAVASSDLDLAISIRDRIAEIKTRYNPPPILFGKQNAETGKTSSDEGPRKKKLASKFAGRKYKILFSSTKGVRTWMLDGSGVVLSDGKPTGTRWFAIHQNGVICIGTDTNNIDLLTVSEDGKTCELRHIGNISQSTIIHPGFAVEPNESR